MTPTIPAIRFSIPHEDEPSEKAVPTSKPSRCPMTLPYALEAAFTGFVTVASAASTLMLSQIQVSPTPEVIESAMEMRLIMVPLIGGICTMLGAVFLYPGVETTQVKVGRACFGVFAAIVGPQIGGFIHPGLKDLGLNPFVLFLLGGIFAFLSFMFSRSVVQGISNRSDALTRRALDNAEKKYLPPKPQDP